MERAFVIYHANCPDGFGAAVVAYCHFRQGDDCLCDFVAASFGQSPPEVTGRQVYILDFSYTRPVLKTMCRTAQSVTIIDHHISAEQALAGLEKEHGNLRVIFDLDKSGAVLTWEFFHHTPPPRLLLHIQDRDLWQFALEGTNDLYAALQARPFDFQAWSALIDDGELPASLFAEGEAINRYRREMIAMHRDKAVIGTIDGCQVPIVNCYDEIASDLLGELAEYHPFAVGYQDHGTLRKWSLRSSASGADVAQIATRFGGGGHRHAAGFITQLPEGLLHISSQTGEGGGAAAGPGGSPTCSHVKEELSHECTPPPQRCDHTVRTYKLCLALNDIMIPINLSHDFEEIFQKVMEDSCKALGCESARIAMREGDNWVIRYVSNLPDELIGRSFTDADLPHAALVLTTRKPVAIDDALHDDRTNTGMMESLGIKSVLVLPLFEKEVVTGTLMFGYHARAVSFSDAELDYAERMTTGIAIAIQNARLHQELDESKRLGDALSEIDNVLYSTQDYNVIMNKMLQLATDAIGAETAVIFSKEGERWVVRNEYKLPVSLLGQSFSNTEVMHTAITAETKRSLAVNDVLNSPDIDQKFVEMLGIRSLLDFPLVLKGEVIGDLTFHHHSSPVPFNERQMEFVRKLQIAISLALENIQLLDTHKQSAAELKSANQELEAFNYTVAHDLRTPLNTLGLSCQAIEMICGDQLDEECRDYVRNIYNSTLKMNELIDALLTFSRMAHVEPHREKIDLSVLAQEVVTMLQQTEPERQVDFRIAAGIEANGDARLLSVVLNNLLGNAWKYTVRQENAVIEFAAKVIDGELTYFVRDNGEGFDKTKAAKLFVPFQRLPSAERSKGFGIGLATVERIIRRHGGRIWADGEPGKGACFYFTLTAN